MDIKITPQQKKKNHKKLPPREYPFSDYVDSKNRAIRSFSPIKSSSHTHEHGSELNSDPCSWVCQPRLIRLNGRIDGFFDLKIRKFTFLGSYIFHFW